MRAGKLETQAGGRPDGLSWAQRLWSFWESCSVDGPLRVPSVTRSLREFSSATVDT